MNLADFLNEFLKNSQRYFERGKYFSQKSRYQEALEQYAESIENYATYIASFRPHIFHESEYDLRKATLIFLCSLFIQIEICYRQVGDHKNADIFINVLKEVDECFQKIYQGLNAKELDFYENFSQGLKTHTANMQDLQDLQVLQDLTAIQKSKISSKYSSYELDKLAERIIAELDKCRKYDICPLKPKTLELENSSSDSCFIATAAYSTATHPDLDTFRQFRDEKLLTHSVGKHLVSIYYQIGPSIAQYVKKHQHIKRFLREQLGRLAEWMRRQKASDK
jgi:tetratricopeptide (TPR) repeat protein